MKIDRQKIYEKYTGRCAYCGNPIYFKDMQVDHIVPKRKYGTDDFENLNPSCRRCNHYKRTFDLEFYRHLIKELHGKLNDNYLHKVALDYGMIKIEEWDGEFYFETQERLRQIKSPYVIRTRDVI
jgi:hypothetical protein